MVLFRKSEGKFQNIIFMYQSLLISKVGLKKYNDISNSIEKIEKGPNIC